MKKDYGFVVGDLAVLNSDSTEYLKLKITRIYNLRGSKTAECRCSTDWNFDFSLVKHYHLRDLKKKPLQVERKIVSLVEQTKE